MGDHPAISVLIAVRNGEAFLDAALASLARQTFGAFEVIVVDNGSTDGTRAILEDWLRRDARIRSAPFCRPGMPATLNHAASFARAPLLARLDADDEALPDRLERQHDRMAADPSIGLLAAHAELIDRRGARIGIAHPPDDEAELRRGLRSQNLFVHSSIMMRRSLFERLGGYRDGLCAAEDYDLWLRMAEMARIAVVPKVLVRYRLHSGSLTARRPVRFAVGATCAAAAAEARRLGVAEPFIRGVPDLRRALDLLGRSREQFLRDVRSFALRQAFEGAYLGIPLPGAIKYRIRRMAAGIGLKALFYRLLWPARTHRPLDYRSIASGGA